MYENIILSFRAAVINLKRLRALMQSTPQMVQSPLPNLTRVDIGLSYALFISRFSTTSPSTIGSPWQPLTWHCKCFAYGRSCCPFSWYTYIHTYLFHHSLNTYIHTYTSSLTDYWIHRSWKDSRSYYRSVDRHIRFGMYVCMYVCMYVYVIPYIHTNGTSGGQD